MRRLILAAIAAAALMIAGATNAGATTFFSDTFDRTLVVDSWGTSTSGEVYNCDATPGWTHVIQAGPTLGYISTNAFVFGTLHCPTDDDYSVQQDAGGLTTTFSGWVGANAAPTSTGHEIGEGLDLLRSSDGVTMFYQEVSNRLNVCHIQVQLYENTAIGQKKFGTYSYDVTGASGVNCPTDGTLIRTSTTIKSVATSNSSCFQSTSSATDRECYKIGVQAFTKDAGSGPFHYSYWPSSSCGPSDLHETICAVDNTPAAGPDYTVPAQGTFGGQASDDVGTSSTTWTVHYFNNLEVDQA